jgi:uncharacterized membrane protein YeaQ/YmgE (transglycosylase-associated protein family)
MLLSPAVRLRAAARYGTFGIISKTAPLARLTSLAQGAADAASGVVRKETVMGIIAWIVVGLIGGAIAKMLMPGDDPGGIIVTILLGIAGAIVGGFIAVALGLSNGIDDFDVGSIVLSIVGAMLLLFGYRAVTGSSGARL